MIMPKRKSSVCIFCKYCRSYQARYTDDDFIMTCKLDHHWFEWKIFDSQPAPEDCPYLLELLLLDEED
jgi:hypothetical protein